MSDRNTSPEPPDLDLIQRVQRARMAHDREATPSGVGGVYWIEARRQNDGPTATARAGMFVIPTDAQAADALWATVKHATESGELGYKSKVSTASRSGAGNDRVIHVMTYDADDMADVSRIARALEALDIQPAEYRRANL